MVTSQSNPYFGHGTPGKKIENEKNEKKPSTEISKSTETSKLVRRAIRACKKMRVSRTS